MGYDYVGYVQFLSLLSYWLHHLLLFIVVVFLFFLFDLSDFNILMIDYLFLISLLFGFFYIEGFAEVPALYHRIVLHVG